jgi:ATP-dependent DNA helicase RecG
MSLPENVQYLKGVGPARARRLERLGVSTVEDLLYYFPRDYQDRRRISPIRTLKDGDFAAVRGEVLAKGSRKTRSGKKVFQLVVDDGSGRLPCLWFNQSYLDNVFQPGQEAAFIGRVQLYRTLQMVNPEYELIDPEDGSMSRAGRIIPVYPLTEGLNQKWLRDLIERALDLYLPSLPDLFPEPLRRPWQVISLAGAIRDIHYPADRPALEEARKRLILDEFFTLQLALGLKRAQRDREVKSLPHSPNTPLRDRYIASLPFRLTGAQRRAAEEIKADMIGQRAMNRLLQGDVGSGKTVVAVCALLTTVDSGYQGAIMAPTEILAAQHWENIRRELEPLGVETVLLTSGIKGKKRREALERIAAGEIKVVAGTHALIQEKVDFRRLGMVVIDEQHKFGVRQRADLRSKGVSPHVLVMTATPIPRTLSLTVYGDLDISLLDEMPPGREKVRTYWISPDRLEGAYGFIRKEVAAGRQAFIIYPMIEESEQLELKAAAAMFDRLRREVFPGLPVDLIHGRLPSEQKREVMERFRNKETMILVSTTVVEIGIDIPDATVMLIENAERFGLAQLHQLRGRVGRSRHPSYCILQGNPRTEDAARRLRAIRDIDDGFQIAREDLEIRGPGEFFGTQQTGLPELRIGSIVADFQLMEFARRQAFSLLRSDPALAAPELAPLRRRLRRRYGHSFDLGDVG